MRHRTTMSMAISDRDRHSFQFNSLSSCIIVSYYVLTTCVLQISATPGQCLDQPPSSVVTFLDEYASFQCSIGEGDNILWFVDDVYVTGLPREYGASFIPGNSTLNCIKSMLQILAIDQTNNSRIQCAVGINGRLNRSYFPSTVLLQVQGPPLPPANLQGNVSTVTDSIIIELIWEEPSALINNSIHGYTIQLNISMDMSEYLIYVETTNATSFEYNVSNDGVYLCNISSVRVNIYAHNKVGIGEEAEKTILPNTEHCISSTSSAAVVVTSSILLSLAPNLPPNANKNSMLIYGAVGGILAVSMLLTTITVIVTTVHLLGKKKHRSRVTNNERKIPVTSNDAYASVQVQKSDDMHIYEEITTHNQSKMKVTMNEAYACTRFGSNQTH